MKPYTSDIESDTIANDAYRRVVHTGEHLQLVLMSLAPREEIGLETHAGHDQFIRVESGVGKAVLGGTETPLGDGSAVVIPAGTEHNVINTSDSEPLKLYTLYSPPEHPDALVQMTKP
jgi:mannose-6-phosphate isomerase-like protein (cupin superfamily)